MVFEQHFNEKIHYRNSFYFYLTPLEMETAKAYLYSSTSSLDKSLNDQIFSSPPNNNHDDNNINKNNMIYSSDDGPISNSNSNYNIINTKSNIIDQPITPSNKPTICSTLILDTFLNDYNDNYFDNNDIIYNKKNNYNENIISKIQSSYDYSTNTQPIINTNNTPNLNNNNNNNNNNYKQTIIDKSNTSDDLHHLGGKKKLNSGMFKNLFIRISFKKK